MRAKDIAGRNGDPKEVFNGLDFSVNARFGQGGVVMGGVAMGRTLFDYCWQNDLPNVNQVGTPGFTVQTGAVSGYLPRTDGFCSIQTAWWDGVGSQIKLQAVYPLPLDFTVSGTYKLLPGIPIPATWNVPNSAVAPSLGRDLSRVPGPDRRRVHRHHERGAAAERVLSREPLGGEDGRAHQPGGPAADEAVPAAAAAGSRPSRSSTTLFNSRPAQGIVGTYGPAWQFPFAILGGRLFKIGAQIDLN